MPVQDCGSATTPSLRTKIVLAAASVAGLALAALSAIAPAGTASVRPPAAAQPAVAATVPALPAFAQFVAPPRVAPADAELEQACARPSRPGQMACMALVSARGRRAGPDIGTPAGYTPADLQDAYGLASAAAKPGGGETIAVVDAFNDPAAAADLAAYRARFRLPACTTGSGCLTIRNQYGGPRLPASDPGGGWELEESLDLDMVSAICPNCAILLIEANSASISDLARAELAASRTPGVDAVSNSWGSGAEFIGEKEYDPDFYAPGVAITAAAGDDGYGTQYPAVSPYVTSVGGTSLVGTIGSWTQSAWSLSGAGCSELEPKPSWQNRDDTSPGGCLNRTENDVSADADPSTGVAVYDSVSDPELGGAPDWLSVGGTSVATPIVAATYGLAGIQAGRPGRARMPGTVPAAYPYQAAGGLTDVTAGADGSCDRTYLCTAGKGFDGPTGLGTPAGTAAFTGPAAGEVTMIDPGPQVVQAGARMHLPLDYEPAGKTPAFSTPSRLPGTLFVTRSGVLTGAAPAKAGVYRVTVTARVAGEGTGRTRFSVVVLPKLRITRPQSGQVRLEGGRRCLTDAGNSDRAGTAARIETCAAGAAQRWAFVPSGTVGGAGELKIHGKCLAIRTGHGNGAKATIQTCASSSRLQWSYQGGGHLRNAGTGNCLDINGVATAGRQAVTWSCGSAGTGWVLPAAPVLSAIAHRCLADPKGSAAAGTRIQLASCGARSSQRFTAERDGTLVTAGECVGVHVASRYDGAAIELQNCSGKSDQQWLRGPDGELINANSGRCLADPGDSGASGVQLVQEDCYSLPGEIWIVS
jgi:hypothetical protein